MKSSRWIGTLNNPKAEPEEFLRLWFEKAGARYVTGQLEKGQEGTVHIQYALYFKDPVRLAGLKKHCSQSHFEAVKQDNGVAEYCNKEETRVEGPWEFGEKPYRRNDKMSVQEMNKKILELGIKRSVDEGLISIKEADKVQRGINAYKMDMAVQKKRELKAIWIVGPPGTGKTHMAIHMTPESFYMKNQNKWWDGYHGQETVILDDLDLGAKGLGHLLKRWADVWAASGEVKGGTVPLNYKHFVVTSNYYPEQIWVDLPERPIKEAICDRFEIVELLGKSRRGDLQGPCDSGDNPPLTE